jgi:hypothetical protein
MMVEAALRYAELGWPVLPLVAGGKAPRISKREGGRGYKDATTSPAAIERWWARWPDSNIGIATGQGVLAVVDVDPREGGDEQLGRLCREASWDPKTATVRSGGLDRGRHLYFRCEDPALMARNFARRPGLRLQARGAYVVAPPSLHPSGQRYSWLRAPEHGLEALPGWILDRLNNPDRRGPAKAATRDGELSASVDFLKTIPPPEYFADLAGRKVGVGGGHVRCPAPDHPDRTPSCMVYPNASGPESGWYCFGCKRGGSIYDLAGMLAGQAVPLPRGAVFLKVEDFLISFYSRKLGVE